MHHKRTRKVLQTKSFPKKHKKILPKHLSGRVVHHRHTSYGLLVLLLVAAFLPLFLVSRGIASAAPTDPVEGSYATYAVVPGPTPETAPSITSPVNGAVFTSNDPTNVTGLCPDGLLIKVFKNDVLAGAVFCNGGRFSVNIDLFLGSNTLIARAYNANNAASPDSSSVVVRREPSGANQSYAGQFFVTSDIFYRGINVGDTLRWELVISGGQAPYAISIAWGDGKSDLISRGRAGTFDITHVYDKPGQGLHSSYDVTIKATDGAGSKSFLPLVSIVSGDQPTVISTIKAGYNWSTLLRIAWQLLILAIAIVLSFWLGERRELWLLKRMGKA